MKLLSRQEFKEAVFKRDKDKCVLCGSPAVDAHHIIDRKVWPDGGYYIDNGASVCADCHWKCERSEILPDKIRSTIGLSTVLPPGLDTSKSYDKWGKEVVPKQNSEIGGSDDGNRSLYAAQR